jgi:hypothetical protein
LPSGADPGKGSVVGDPSPDPADGGEPGTIGFACDDLGMVLQQHADPNAEHNGTMASGTAEATAGGGSESASASMGWADGGREGQVSLSVEQRSTSADCLDPSLGAGPEVNCERTTLDDGTVVWVGHGAQAGARRVAVEYERPDGSVVWATADEATDAWWRGDHARDPLTAPPMTFDDLVAMARDKAIK